MKTRHATIVVDLGFGDAGKGSIVDYLCRKRNVSAVVRFNGGAQAAHNVVTPDGRHHTFAQFGSGSFVPGVRTHLSRFMLVDPVSLVNEARHLMELGVPNPFHLLSIDKSALVVTPFQKAANRIRETLRGTNKHGSCGMGIGETMADSIAFPKSAVRVGDLANQVVLARKLTEIQELKRDEFRLSLPELTAFPHLRNESILFSDGKAPEEWAATFSEFAKRFRVVSGEYLKDLSALGDLVFEGAQGVLIDEWHGFHPYTTWSTTTFANALELLEGIGYDGQIEKLGVLRAYFTRHGAGPFPTEDAGLTLALPDKYNGNGRWQGSFRVGWFDMVLAKYALTVSGEPDSLAITNLDRFANVRNPKICIGYDVPQGVITTSDREGVVFAESDFMNSERVETFKPKHSLTDLGYQEKLTRILKSIIPAYQVAPENNVQYLRMIEQMIGAPVVIASYGPTALDKRIPDSEGCINCAA